MQSFFKRPDRNKKYILIAGDFLGIAVSLFLTFTFQIVYRGRWEFFVKPFSDLALLPALLAVVNLAVLFMSFSLAVGIVYIALYYVVGLYEMELLFNRKRTLIKLSAGAFLGTLCVYSLLSVFSYTIFGRLAWGFHLLTVFCILLSWRYFFFTRLASANPFEILVIEKDKLAEKAMACLNNNRGSTLFRFVFQSSDDFFHEQAFQEKSQPPQGGYQMIVYPYSNGFSPRHITSLIRKKFDGLTICNSLTFYKNCTGSFPVFDLDGHWLVNLSTSLALSRPHQRRLKRLIDIFFAVVGIVSSFPFMVLAAVSIKLTSRGPVLFAQQRLGRYEKPFWLFKFRTMVENAEKVSGPVWAKKNDSRVTPLGKFLRRTRIDELPQFFNILKGDMSFIGPRPIRKFFADKLAEEFPYYFLRFSVKPGLTGWAQVSENYPDTVEGQRKKLEYELFYIHEYSLLLDGVITLKTVQRMLWGRGQ